MNQKLLKLIFILIIPIISSHSCRKEVDDPCADAQNFKADFKIGVSKYSWYNYPNGLFLEKDTIYHGSLEWVNFKCEGDYDSVKWVVGSDPRTFTNQNFRLSFMVYETIPVTLYAFRKSGIWQQCSNAKKTDTITKSFTIIHDTINTPKYLGNWLGALENNPMDTFRVTIFRQPFSHIYRYYISNIPKGCPHPSTPKIELYDNGYKEFAFNKQDIYCKTVEWAFGKVDEQNKLVIEYRQGDYQDSLSYKTYKFIGTKID